MSKSKAQIRFELDGTVFVWDLKLNYCEIYNSNELTPKHLIATVPANEMFDMLTYMDLTLHDESILSDISD